MNMEYYRQVTIADYIVGKGRNGVVYVKRYTMVNGYHSDYPLYVFPIETLGM